MLKVFSISASCLGPLPKAAVALGTSPEFLSPRKVRKNTGRLYATLCLKSTTNNCWTKLSRNMQTLLLLKAHLIATNWLLCSCIGHTGVITSGMTCHGKPSGNGSRPNAFCSAVDIQYKCLAQRTASDGGSHLTQVVISVHTRHAPSLISFLIADSHLSRVATRLGMTQLSM